ncbi:hypothetical protein D917_09393 [Trichinella nativa]|uniref:Uncharacterized protein n=1 Tax=Trichinella nativa TaxID=6335 RepID=A0A1Y3EFP1_9BILA|nr:hypothetical protein D917_09393 [Trichinella nativa]
MLLTAHDRGDGRVGCRQMGGARHDSISRPKEGAQRAVGELATLSTAKKSADQQPDQTSDKLVYLSPLLKHKRDTIESDGG